MTSVCSAGSRRVRTPRAAGTTPSISIHAATDRLLAEPALLGDPWSAVYVPLASDDAGTTEAVFADSPEVASWFTMVDTSGTTDGERLHVRLLGGEADAAQFALGAGRLPRQDGEAIAGYGLFESEGWQLGESIEVIVGGRSESAHWWAAPFRLAMAIMSGLIVAVALAHLAATALGWALQRVFGDAITAGVGVGPDAGGSLPVVVVMLSACVLVLGVVVESLFTATRLAGAGGCRPCKPPRARRGGRR